MNSKLLVLPIVSFLLSPTMFAAGNVQVPEDAPLLESRMVCPEKGPFPFSHGSTIVQLHNGTLFCAWYAGSREKGDDVVIACGELVEGATAWSEPRVLVDTPGKSEGNPVLFLQESGTLWLFYQTMYGSGEGRTRQGTGWTTCKVKAITSEDGGRTWSEERILIDELGYLTRNKPCVLKSGAILLPIQDERNWSSAILISEDDGKTWEMSEAIDCGLGFHDGNIEPALLERKDGSILCYMRAGTVNHKRYRTWKSVSTDGGRHWTQPVEIDVPNPDAALDLLRLDSGNVLMALNPVPEGNRKKLSLWLSSDDAETWWVFRDVANGLGHCSYPALINGRDGRIHLTCSRPDGGIKHMTFNESWVWQNALVAGEYELSNVLAPLDNPDDPRSLHGPRDLPIRVDPFIEHVKGTVSGLPEGEAKAVAVDEEGHLVVAVGEACFRRDAEGSWKDVGPAPFSKTRQLDPRIRVRGVAGTGPNISAIMFEGISGPIRVRALIESDKSTWIATDQGLFVQDRGTGKVARHDRYGVDGPLATEITALAVDSKGTLWVGTPLGLSLRKGNGSWSHIRGKEGLPVEDVTSLAIDENDRLWIGTSQGAIHYRPYEEGRQWFYRAGGRYLPDDRVIDVALAPGGMPAYFATPAGVGRIDAVTTTLREKAERIEQRIAERHRRFGLVAACVLDDAENPTSHTIPDNDNDGLWTSYHVIAMALRYAVTADEAALRSASESMHGLILLQSASGIPGLVARSIVTLAEGESKNEQWRLTPDGDRYWKSDTSNDEIDGHFLAFFTYYHHIARFIPGEKELLEEQVRKVMDYIIDHNYQLIDWDGERTSWGFWNPELLNDDPIHYLENGLNSLQLLSFLKVSHYITGDPKYKEQYDRLIREYGYLNNILLEKKVFPDENNHSDNQLGYVAWYPILQLERDPKVRNALHRASRRHYQTLAADKSSFFNFVSATIDPDYIDLEGAIDNLREIPTDRRQWRTRNSHRADVVFDPRLTRFGRRQLLQVLPADELSFDKWNGNPYVPDGGGDGRVEDDGASYLMPYWLGRYHRFFTE